MKLLQGFAKPLITEIKTSLNPTLHIKSLNSFSKQGCQHKIKNQKKFLKEILKGYQQVF